MISYECLGSIVRSYLRRVYKGMGSWDRTDLSSGTANSKYSGVMDRTARTRFIG